VNTEYPRFVPFVARGTIDNTDNGKDGPKRVRCEIMLRAEAVEMFRAATDEKTLDAIAEWMRPQMRFLGWQEEVEGVDVALNADDSASGTVTFRMAT